MHTGLGIRRINNIDCQQTLPANRHTADIDFLLAHFRAVAISPINI